MMRWTALLVVLLRFARPAAADDPNSGPVTAPYLEKRVPEELATTGVVLSRRNLALKLEPVGQQWIVSLLDISSGRAAASTKLDTLPVEREAAVLVIARTVTELVGQTSARGESAPEPAPSRSPAADSVALGVQQAMREERMERDKRELATSTYQQRSLRYGTAYAVAVPGPQGTTLIGTSTHPRWGWYRGDERVSQDDFYRIVGHPELAPQSTNRRQVMVAGFVTGGVLAGLGASLLFYEDSVYQDCKADILFTINGGVVRNDCDFHWQLPVLVGAAGALTLGITTIYAVHSRPRGNNEKSLADDYNRRLRRELGLPISRGDSAVHDLALAPSLTAQGGELVLRGRF